MKDHENRDLAVDRIQRRFIAAVSLCKANEQLNECSSERQTMAGNAGRC